MLLELLQEENKQLFLELEMLLVNADGEYTECEQEIVAKHCEEMKIEPIEYNPEIILTDILNKINNNMTNKEKKIIFIELITVAIIDGVYDDKEKEYIDMLRVALEIPKEVGEQAFNLIQNLIDTSNKIKNFVEW